MGGRDRIFLLEKGPGRSICSFEFCSGYCLSVRELLIIKLFRLSTMLTVVNTSSTTFAHGLLLVIARTNSLNDEGYQHLIIRHLVHPGNLYYLLTQIPKSSQDLTSLLVAIRGRFIIIKNDRQKTAGQILNNRNRLYFTMEIAGVNRKKRSRILLKQKSAGR